MIPAFALSGKRSLLESDLLYSSRHLLLKLESGSSLLNSLDSVARLKTNSSYYFNTIVYDISFGTTIEDAIEKAIEYSPSKAFTKILDEIKNSLKTGADIEKTLKSTLDDVAKLHLIQIQEYGKKLNPMSMFYMIIGTISPSLGTAMLVVASSLLPGVLIIDMRILLSIAFLLLVIQVFFVLAFKSLKPSVIE
jgi:type II secretory pathway component PulF